ncbi:ComF family protein [Pseudothermotoga thermarum]|uniref:Phosphoribosyltransferase n=1 Tax=Pseudothermotoga thermarum DSM 5069 TaxID=688269 RepID=F7YXW6_9THEM|nr:ComF family protein [Pseudothermotoga thermarum]AEH50765.1 phosphoribosyltransferase [Pseudothermotoga thermarum DSM 5069]
MIVLSFLEKVFLEFFPNSCPLCGKRIGIKELLCQTCEKEIKNGPLPIVHKSKFFTAYFYGKYESKLRDLILAYKNGKHWRLSKVIAYCMADLITRYPSSADLLTWVPSSYKATEERGFETMRLVAENLSKALKIPAKKLLESKAKTSRRGIAGNDRIRIVDGMIYPVGQISGDIVLIDDVFTTGKTVAECVHVLKNNGARNVTVYCLAIVQR